MTFRTVCLLGILSALPFGLAFLLMPETASGIYEITGWNSSTTVIGRLFGVELLYVSGALLAVRGTTDAVVQRRLAAALCVASVVATALLVHAVVSGAVGVLAWSSALLYAFFAVAWGSVAARLGKAT